MTRQHDPNTKYHVTRWDDGSIVRTFDKLRLAEKKARGMGHTGEDNPILTGYPPIAFVANDAGEVVYNPRFGKLISSAVGSIVNSNDDHLRG